MFYNFIITLLSSLVVNQALIDIQRYKKSVSKMINLHNLNSPDYQSIKNQTQISSRNLNYFDSNASLVYYTK